MASSPTPAEVQARPEPGAAWLRRRSSSGRLVARADRRCAAEAAPGGERDAGVTRDDLQVLVRAVPRCAREGAAEAPAIRAADPSERSQQRHGSVAVPDQGWRLDLRTPRRS